MSAATKDGAWISLNVQVVVRCTKCGEVKTINHPLNSREEDEVIAEHAAKHGGRDRGY